MAATKNAVLCQTIVPAGYQCCLESKWKINQVRTGDKVTIRKCHDTVAALALNFLLQKKVAITFKSNL